MMKLGISIKSKATAAAMGKAEKVALGGKYARTSTPTPASISMPKKMTHPGSVAGLDRTKKVHLDLNGSGYANPNIQRARHQPKKMQLPRFQPGQSRLSHTGSFLDTRPLNASGGSVNMIRERM